VIPAQTVFANLVCARTVIRNHDAGVVAGFPADHLGAGHRIDAPESGLDRQPVVDPTGFQIRVVLNRQVGSG
jgi:hypothetical protein